MGGPYVPTTPMLGGHPVPKVDDPICSVLLPFFVASAFINVTIFIRNKKAGHKFAMSMPLFGFSMTRIVTLALRMTWASEPTNAHVIVAASLFTNVGVMVLFVVNLILTQRIVRAKHPKFGWSLPITWAFRFLVFCIIALLFTVVPAIVYSFFTLNRHKLQQTRDIQRTAGTCLAVLAFLPVPIIIATLLVPSEETLDKFGSGRWRTKVYMVLFTATILAFGAAFRIGVSFATGTTYEWFHQKAIFYCVNFAIELMVVYTYIFMRFDKRFHIPNGSSAPGHYRSGNALGSGSSDDETAKEKGQHDPDESMSDDAQTFLGRIITEEEVLGGTKRPKSKRGATVSV